MNLIRFVPLGKPFTAPILRSEVSGVDFPSPIGLAAGFDKDALVFEKMYRFGFGSVEVGTLTPAPQAGNPRPRIERLCADEAIINKMGFPNRGILKALKRISRFSKLPGPLGINIGANAVAVDKIEDYVQGYRQAASCADYVTINVSSPNTPGLRSFESGSSLTKLLKRLDTEIENFKTPIYIKVSPDLSIEEIDSTCNALLRSKISAVIVGNTSVRRSFGLKSKYKSSGGGISGKPIKGLSEKSLVYFYERLGKKIPVISVGGIADAEDVFQRILNGASLVQIYTSFIYEGPYSVRRMNRKLAALLVEHEFPSLQSAVGCQVKAESIRIREVARPIVRPRLSVSAGSAI